MPAGRQAGRQATGSESRETPPSDGNILQNFEASKGWGAAISRCNVGIVARLWMKLDTVRPYVTLSPRLNGTLLCFPLFSLCRVGKGREK